MVSERRQRKNKTSFLNDIQEDFQEIEDNFQTNFTEENIAQPKVNVEVDMVTSTNTDDLQALQLSYEKKLEVLRIENERLKAGKREFTINERRLINAIKAEVIIQKRNDPIIGRSKLKKEYGINSKYLDSAITGLINQSIIERKLIKFTQKINTFQWKLLKEY